MRRPPGVRSVKLVEYLEEPSGVVLFMVEDSDDYREQLPALLPGRHFIKPRDEIDLTSVYVPDTAAAAMARMIFAEDAFESPGVPLSRLDEHRAWRQYGGWPWD